MRSAPLPPFAVFCVSFYVIFTFSFVITITLAAICRLVFSLELSSTILPWARSTKITLPHELSQVTVSLPSSFSKTLHLFFFFFFADEDQDWLLKTAF